jgi:hypothetical protein
MLRASIVVVVVVVVVALGWRLTSRLRAWEVRDLTSPLASTSCKLLAR